MSEPTNKTNDLDSYGVWVKKPQEASSVSDSVENTEFDSLNIEDDLPDFSSFEDISDSSLDVQNEETALTTEELSNIAVSADNTEEVKDNSDFSVDDVFGDFEDIGEVETKKEDTSIPVEDDSFKMDDITSDFTEINTNEDKIDDITSDFTDVSTDSDKTEEIDLDAFGITDSDSPAKESSGEESIDLDDFLDTSSSAEQAPAEEEVIDEDPLDINLSFDENNEDMIEEEKEEIVPEEAVPEEKIEVSENIEVQPATDEDSAIDTESIDLSEFGIDEEEEDSGSVAFNGVTEKKEIVDYDMKVSADSDDEKNVSLSDVVMGKIEEENIPDTFDEETASLTEDIESPTLQPQDPQISAKGQQILEQIVGELAELKNEISSLKHDFTDLKNNGVATKVEEDKENTGFFSDADDDDTIALSGDELDNIMNTAEFSSSEETEAQEDTIADESLSLDTPQVEIEEPVTENIEQEEISVEEPIIDDVVQEEISVEEPVVDDLVQEEIAVEEPVVEDLAQEDVIVEEPVVDETLIESESNDEQAKENTSVIDDMFDNAEITDDAAIEDTNDNLTLDFSNDSLEEPEIDSLSINDIDEESPSVSEELPDEISIPKVDDILVESSASDLMDSIVETDKVEPTQESEIEDINSSFEDLIAPDTPVSETLTDDKINYLSENEEDISENTVIDEPLDVAEDTVTTNDNEASVIENNVDSNLKEEIKSVLSYMNELLENLPDDKISEFAKSEQFVTYQKLFRELGLS